jgi:serine protease Do
VERAQIGISGGLLVQNVSGRASEAGIEPGDIILSVDDTPVASAKQMGVALSAHDKDVALLVQRGSERLFFPVQSG